MSNVSPQIVGLANEAYETVRERQAQLGLTDAECARGLVLAACASARRAGVDALTLLSEAFEHLHRLEHDTEPGASPASTSSVPPAAAG